METVLDYQLNGLGNKMKAPPPFFLTSILPLHQPSLKNTQCPDLYINLR